MLLVKKEVDQKEFLSKRRTVIKNLLKKHTKAYTVFDLEFGDDQTFKFKRSLRKNKIRINGKKIWSGYYEAEIDEERRKVELRIYLHKKAKESSGTTD